MVSCVPIDNRHAACQAAPQRNHFNRSEHWKLSKDLQFWRALALTSGRRYSPSTSRDTPLARNCLWSCNPSRPRDCSARCTTSTAAESDNWLVLGTSLRRSSSCPTGIVSAPFSVPVSSISLGSRTSMKSTSCGFFEQLHQLFVCDLLRSFGFRLTGHKRSPGEDDTHGTKPIDASHGRKCTMGRYGFCTGRVLPNSQVAALRVHRRQRDEGPLARRSIRRRGFWHGQP